MVFGNFIFDLVFAAIVLKKLSKMFAIFIGFVTDSSFWESLVGVDVADLVIEIKFSVSFHVLLDHLVALEKVIIVNLFTCFSKC